MAESLRAALQDFYDEQAYKGNSPATIQFYRVNMEHYLRDTGVTTLEGFTMVSVRRWLLDHGHLSRASLRTYDRSIRVVGNWLHRRGYLPANPLAELPKPKSQRHAIGTFTAEEIAAMLAVARGRRHPLRNVALLTLLLDTGVRIGEATSLQLHDIDWPEGWLRVDGKSDARSVPFGRKAKLALRRYIDQERTANSRSQRSVFLSQSGDVFTSHAGTLTVRRLAEAAGVSATKLGPHTLRHTFALEFIRGGGDAFALQRLLGHATLDMTRRYVHLADTDLRSAHKRFGPADRML